MATHSYAVLAIGYDMSRPLTRSSRYAEVDMNNLGGGAIVGKSVAKPEGSATLT